MRLALYIHIFVDVVHTCFTVVIEFIATMIDYILLLFANIHMSWIIYGSHMS